MQTHPEITNIAVTRNAAPGGTAWLVAAAYLALSATLTAEPAQPAGQGSKAPAADKSPSQPATAPPAAATKPAAPPVAFIGSPPDLESVMAPVKKLNAKFVTKGERPSWSPDGKKLVFGKHAATGGNFSKEGIAILDLTTGATSDLIDSGKDPAWSGDGGWIAYVSKEGEVWICKPSGAQRHKVGKGTGPTWTADGRRLFFSSYPGTQLMVMEMDGSEPGPPPKPLGKLDTFFPAISADGSRLADRAGDTLVIKALPLADNKVPKRLLLPAGRGFLGGWSPDGTQLGFGGFGWSSDPFMILNVETGRAVQVAAGLLTYPAWSPDGSKIAFDIRSREHGNEIWLLQTAALKGLPSVELPVR